MDNIAEKVGFNAYTLKMIAIIGMVMQHTAIVLADIMPLGLEIPLHFAGGFTFPIMAFMLVEGYRKTSNLKRYILRMFIFALVAQAPFMLAFANTEMFWQLNIMFTLMFGLFTLIIYDKMKARWLFWIIFVIYVIASTFFVNWGLFGPLMILLYHVFTKETSRRIMPGIIIASSMAAFGLIGLCSVAMLDFAGGTDPKIAYILGDVGTQEMMNALVLNLAFAIGIFVPVFLLHRYNSQRGRDVRYLFYAIYPLHLLILAGISLVIGG